MDTYSNFGFVKVYTGRAFCFVRFFWFLVIDQAFSMGKLKQVDMK